MQVNNQTSDPVDWEQHGGTPNEEEQARRLDESGDPCPITGRLGPGEKSEPFTPCGLSPYTVSFVTTSVSKPPRTAAAEGILADDAEVVVVSFPLVF